jgi:acetolactate synthase-1/2/3 large subunit
MLNNNGYTSIRLTQDAYFPGGYIAADPTSGVTFPDIQKICAAYGIPSNKAANHQELQDKIRQTLAASGPALCEIMMSPVQPLYPKLASEVRPDGTMVSKPLEDMFPFLDRAEFLENMQIEPWDSNK